MKFIKFITSTVVISIAIGIILLIIGQTDAPHIWFPTLIKESSDLNSVIKSVGTIVLGSGVFTAIIKSSAYTQVFSGVIEDIIWSKKFIEKRKDKKEIWSMVSSLLYEEKFPQISDEIQEIITSQYLPTMSDYYVEDYYFLINVTDHSTHFWNHHETLKLTIRPTDQKSSVTYKSVTGINLLDATSVTAGVADATNFVIEEVRVNDKVQSMSHAPYVKQGWLLKHTLEIPMQNETEYKLVIKRHKILCKKTNLDKRFFCPVIINDLTVNIMMPVGMEVDFHKMGTVKEYVKDEDEINNQTRLLSYSYKGLILPQQGFIMVFK